MDNSPVKLTAPIKDYLWGGTRLISDFGKKTNLEKAAESWELSTHPDGESVICSGEFDGMKLSDYIKANGNADCIGSRAAEFDFFPILIKLIDAKDNLSIQVHPDDEYALKNEKEYGKTEMWYIVDCEEGAYIYYGLKDTISKEEFQNRIENNTLLEILNKVEVHKGDVFFIPSGTIHAICSGILICEVQQNSNTTYRVYDYDRVGADGKKRELHIKKAMDVSNLFPAPPINKSSSSTLASCKYFTAEKIECTSEVIIKIDKSSFRSLVITEGCGSLELNSEVMQFKKGESIFIPAQNMDVKFNGDFTAILSYV